MAEIKKPLNQLVKLKPSPMQENFEEVDLERSDSSTYIALCLDSSGSMCGHVEEVVRGFNEHVRTIRRTAEHDVWTWFKLFGVAGIDQIEDRVKRGSVSDLDELTTKTYHPYGSTPLLDAIGQSICQLETEDRNNPDQAFLVIAFSDGHENASHHWSWTSLGDAIRSKDDRWTFVFVGPKSEHSKLEGVGFKPENMLDWDDYRIPQLMSQTSSALGRYLSERNVGGLLPAFFEEDDS